LVRRRDSGAHPARRTGGGGAAIGIVDDKAVSLILDTAKSGRIYKRRGVTHQASAPGEPPASDTGTLVNSRRIERYPDRYAAALIFSAKHALPLELGTRDMDARPFGARSLVETEAEIRAAIAEGIRIAML